MKKEQTPAEIRQKQFYASIIEHLHSLGLELEIDHIDEGTNKPIYSLYSVNEKKLILTDLYDGSIETLFHFAIDEYLSFLFEGANEECKTLGIKTYPARQETNDIFKICQHCGKVYKVSEKIKHLEHGCIL